jgi:hypothetical protein
MSKSKEADAELREIARGISASISMLSRQAAQPLAKDRESIDE